MAKRRQKKEMASEKEDGDNKFEEVDEPEREEDINLKRGLEMKRRHFFVVCVFVAIFIMVKLEFSYKKVFSDNIKVFLLSFMIMDIFLEQIMVRLVLNEALLVSPVLGTFVITEFIMTMGAEDLQ